MLTNIFFNVILLREIDEDNPVNMVIGDDSLNTNLLALLYASFVPFELDGLFSRHGRCLFLNPVYQGEANIQHDPVQSNVTEQTVTFVALANTCKDGDYEDMIIKKFNELKNADLGRNKAVMGVGVSGSAIQESLVRKVGEDTEGDVDDNGSDTNGNDAEGLEGIEVGNALVVYNPEARRRNVFRNVNTGEKVEEKHWIQVQRFHLCTACIFALVVDKFAKEKELDYDIQKNQLSNKFTINYEDDLYYKFSLNDGVKNMVHLTYMLINALEKVETSTCMILLKQLHKKLGEELIIKTEDYYFKLFDEVMDTQNTFIILSFIVQNATGLCIKMNNYNNFLWHVKNFCCLEYQESYGKWTIGESGNKKMAIGDSGGFLILDMCHCGMPLLECYQKFIEKSKYKSELNMEKEIVSM